MVDISLQSNEVVVLRKDGIVPRKELKNTSNELILTNLNIILVGKGLMGKIKSVHKYPLSQIKVYNKQAQALFRKQAAGYPRLELYFINGQEYFEFMSGGKRESFNPWGWSNC